MIHKQQKTKKGFSLKCFGMKGENFIFLYVIFLNKNSYHAQSRSQIKKNKKINKTKRSSQRQPAIVSNT